MFFLLDFEGTTRIAHPFTTCPWWRILTKLYVKIFHSHPTPHSLGLNIIRCIILSLWIVISTTIKLLSWTYLFGDSMHESGVKIPSNSNYYDFKNQYIQKRTQAKPDCEIICNVWCFCNKSGTRVFWWLSNTLESENTGGLFFKVNATPKGLLLGPQMFN